MKIGKWFKDNIMLMVITALLGVIGWGGRSLVVDIRDDQQDLEDRQYVMSEELKTYRDVQMGILSTIENDRNASGFWFDAVDKNTEVNCEQEKKITNHEIRISALESH